MSKYCAKCNKNYDNETRFCPECGGQLSENAGFIDLENDNKVSSGVQMTSNVQQASNAEVASIEVYRVSRWVGVLFACKIFLDDKEIGGVSNGDKKRFEITPGLHEIRVKMNWSFIKSRPFSFKIKEGDFIRLRFNFTFGGFSVLTGWWMVKTLFSGGKVYEIEQY